MTTEAVLAVCVWAFAIACAVSKNVTSSAAWLSIIIAIVFSACILGK
jgi:hypothetical protein